MSILYSVAENCSMPAIVDANSFACVDARNQTAECVASQPLVVNESWPYVSVNHDFRRKHARYSRFEVRLVADDEEHRRVPLERRPSLGLPPLHAHHVHVDGHWFETHGDYYQPRRHSYLRELPRGACALSIDNPTSNLYATINLMGGRASVAFRILVLMTPCEDRDALNVSKFDYALFANDLESCWNRYRIPTNVATYTVWRGRHAVSASMVSPRRMLPWVHAHRSHFRGLFMMEGNVSGLPAFPRCDRGSAWSHDIEQPITRTCLCSPPADCDDTTSLLSDPRLVCHILDDKDAASETPAMRCRARGWTFQKDDPYTMIVLSRASESRDALLPQHSHFFFYASVRDDAPRWYYQRMGILDDASFVTQSSHRLFA